MDPLSITAGVIAILHVTVKVCEGLRGNKDASIDRAQFTTEIENLKNLLVALLSYYHENSPEPWHANVRILLGGKDGLIQQYRIALEQLSRKIENEQGVKKIAKTLLWKYIKDDAERILSRVERLKSVVQIALQMDNLKLSQAIECHMTALQGESKIVKQGVHAIEDRMVNLQDDSNITKKAVDTIQENQNLQKHRLIMNWLSSDDFAAQQIDSLSRRQPDTGLWFLNSSEFDQWINGANKTLFCPGIPGAGKTVMAATAIDHLQNTLQSHDVAVAYVYCNYKRQTEQTTQYLFAAILKQLLHDRPLLTQSLETLYDKHQLHRTRLSLGETMNTLRDVLASYSKVYVVIDALDECPSQDGTRRKFLEACRDLQGQADSHLMATSRDVPDVVEYFKNAPRLEVRASDLDVKRYVIGQITELPGCVRHDGDLQELVEKKIAAAVDGMFLLARLHIASLADKRTKTKVISALNELSIGSGALDVAYDEAISRIDSQFQGDRILAKKVLSWISCTLRPLTVGELCHALSVKEDDSDLDVDDISNIEDVLSVCAGLVTVDEESQIIRLVHYTTQDYLESIRDKWNPEAQYDIASACLTYLCFESFKSGACPSDSEFEHRLAEYKFLDYSARHWHQHIGSLQDKLCGLAMVLLRCNQLVDCIFQVTKTLSRYKFRNYSQNYPSRSTGFHLAATCGLATFCERLVCWEEREDVPPMNTGDDEGSVIQRRCGDIGSLLLDTGKADIDAKNSRGETALMIAAKAGFSDVVKVLLHTEKADVEEESNYRQTALMHAVISGSVETIEVLLGVGKADIEARDKYRQIPLLHAANYGKTEVVKVLLSRGVDIEAKGVDVWTPLILAAWNGQTETVEVLLSRGANIEARDTRGWTPLMLAASYGYTETVEVLLNVGKANLEAKEIYSWTPLMFAVYHSNTETVEVLLNVGKANVEAKDSYGWAPLILAASQGYTETVELLINVGKANIEAKTDRGNTALDVAILEGHGKVSDLLKRYGAKTE